MWLCTATTAVDVIFDNRRTLWTEVSGSAKPADNATVDQTGAEIKTLYEAETNAFTDLQFTKLAGIEALAKDDQTKADIKTLFSWSTDPEDGATTDQSESDIKTLFSWTTSPESGATADQTGAEIKAAYEAEDDAYTDALNTKLTQIEAGATKNRLFRAATASIPTSVSIGDIWVDTTTGITYSGLWETPLALS